MNAQEKINSIIGTIFLLLICLLIAYAFNNNRAINQNAILLEDNWHTSLNNKQILKQPEEKLSSYLLPYMHKNDVLVLKRPLNEINIENPTLIFDTWHFITEVYLDDKLIYEQGKETDKKKQMLGNIRHEVSLPNDYNNKKITLKFIATEDSPLEHFESIGLYPANSKGLFWHNRPLIIVFTAIITIVIGFEMVLFAFVFLRNNKRFFSAGTLGISFILMGNYLLCRAKIISFLFPDPFIYNQVEYLSLYLIPVMLCIYVFNINGSKPPKKILRAYHLFISFYIVGLIIATHLNATSSFHFSNLLDVYFILTFIAYGLSYLAMNFLYKRNPKTWMKYTIWAIKIYAYGSIIAILTYKTTQLPLFDITIDLWLYHEYALVWLTFLMLILFSAGLYFNIKDNFTTKHESDRLDYLAHYDVMTMIRNRRSWSEELERLEKNENKQNYGIIIIDLNGLKQTNDTLGHKIGDKMIMNIATALLQIPEQIAIPYRIGGDEFVLVSRNSDQNEMIINKIRSIIKDFNQNNDNYQISVAIGCAKYEENSNPYKLFELADKRMYREKKQMKKSQTEK